MGFVLLGAGLAAEASIAAQRLPGDKVLRAATRRADRARRQGTKIKRKFDAEIVYIEGMLQTGTLPPTAHWTWS